MKNLLVKVALFGINRLLVLVDKGLAKKPNNNTLLKAREELLQVRSTLQNVKF